MRRAAACRRPFGARLGSRLRPFAAALLVYVMTPMATEVTEDLAQLVFAGAEQHDDSDAERGSHGPEHCCSGLMHICGCCHSVAFLTAFTASVAPTSPARQHVSPCPGDVQADGYLSGVFRPPIV